MDLGGDRASRLVDELADTRNLYTLAATQLPPGMATWNSSTPEVKRAPVGAEG